MELRRWQQGLVKRLFTSHSLNAEDLPVRLYCADGQVLYEIYEEICEEERRKGNSAYPVLGKEDAARDFFAAVIREIFQISEIYRSKISEIAQYCEKFGCEREEGWCNHWRVLPLCYFFASIWSFDFRDEDDPGNDSDYRTHRFKEALKWGCGNDDIDYDKGTQHFSDGIEKLFALLARQYKDKIFMPPPGFLYRGSRADGITLSHAIFRYGEIANIYAKFADWGLQPCGIHEDEALIIKRIAADFDNNWRNSRCIDDASTLEKAIKQLYEGWDGKVEEQYKSYIRKHTEAAYGNAIRQPVAGKCKAYWSLFPNGNRLSVGICLDSIESITDDIIVSDGNNTVTIPKKAIMGVSDFKWLENGDRYTRTPGWNDLKSDHEIVFKINNTRVETIVPFRRCFNEHTILLLQSYLPSAGGNPFWRLMVGSKGVFLWEGDGRRKDTRYAIMSPLKLQCQEIKCEGIEALEGPEKIDVKIFDRLYVCYLYKIVGKLNGNLKVRDIQLFNFGTSDDFDISSACGDLPRKFVAAYGSTLVIYLPEKRRIAVYSPQGTKPCLYGVSEVDIRSCEIKPLNSHLIDFAYDKESNLWITETFDECDIPYAIAKSSGNGKDLCFKLLDKNGEDYHKTWKGFFLPKLDENEIIVAGALLARVWRPAIDKVLREGDLSGDTMDGEHCMSELLALLNGIQIQEATEKLEFTQNIGILLTTRLVNGVQTDPSFIGFRGAFSKLPDELKQFLSGIPANGWLPSLNEYFAWALVLLSIYHDDRAGVWEPNSNKLRFWKNLKDFRPNPGMSTRHYCAYFVCKGIVHAVLDGVVDDEAVKIVSRGVALADQLVSSLA